MTQEQQHIHAFVAAIRRCWMGQQAALWGLVGLIGLLAWLLGMVLLDNVLMLSRGQILLGWLAIVALGLGVVGLLCYRLLLRPPGADQFALLYECRVPGVRNRLINAVQMLTSGQADRDAMACAVLLENAVYLDPATASRAVTYRPVRQVGIVAGGVMLLLVIYAAIWPSWMGNALSRVLRPIGPPMHLLATEPVVSPGHVELVEGQPLKIEAQIRRSPEGRMPACVMLEYRVGNLGWVSCAMSTPTNSAGVALRNNNSNKDPAEAGTHTRLEVSTPANDKTPSSNGTPKGDPAYLRVAHEITSNTASGEHFEHTFASIREPLEYRVRADWSVSPTYAVKVHLRPRVESLQVVVSRPAYAGGKTRELKPGTGDVTALEHSGVEIHLGASIGIARGQLALSDGTKVPLTVTGSDARQAAGRFELLGSGTYSISITDSTGLTNLDPPRYALIAEQDQAPVVTIPKPGRELTLPLDATLPITIGADDDVGLTKIGLQVRIGTADWKTVQQWKVSDPAARHQVVQADLALGSWGLKPNDMLLYRAIAYDNRPPQANVGIGRTWSVTLTDPAGDDSVLKTQARLLLEALQRILALQRQNRAELDLDRPVDPIRTRQQQIRDLTIAVIDLEQKALRPMQTALDVLTELADGPMLQAAQSLAKHEGTYQQRAPFKPPILKLMDAIIAKLEALIGQIEKTLASADKAKEELEKLAPADREQALKNIRDLLTRLRDFIPEQDKVIEGTEEIARKGADLTDKDKQKIDQLKDTEDKWDAVFTDSVKDIGKLTEQGFADRSIANDYKEMVEQIEEASKNLTPPLITLAVPREQAGRELAESLAEEMEMWLPNSPDHIKWLMEEPLDQPEIPMPELPDQLSDFIGDLIEEQDELNDAAEDVTSAWADSISAAGWLVADGPISNYSAVGKTGSQLPDNHELSGRSGDGRSGRSQGQLVEDVAKGLPGRKTPMRITNDSYEQGVVKELQQMATGGATGGGKARGAGQEGLQGESPPPLMRDMQFMKQWQQRIRQKAEKVAGQLQQLRVPSPDLDRSIGLMKQAEQAAQEGRYGDLFQKQQMVLQNLKMAGDLAARETALNVDRAQLVPANQRRPVLDAMDEPVPQEYEDAVRRYFLQLSETK